MKQIIKDIYNNLYISGIQGKDKINLYYKYFGYCLYQFILNQQVIWLLYYILKQILQVIVYIIYINETGNSNQYIFKTAINYLKLYNGYLTITSM